MALGDRVDLPDLWSSVRVVVLPTPQYWTVVSQSCLTARRSLLSGQHPVVFGWLALAARTPIGSCPAGPFPHAGHCPVSGPPCLDPGTGQWSAWEPQPCPHPGVVVVEGRAPTWCPWPQRRPARPGHGVMLNIFIYTQTLIVLLAH